MMKGLERIRYGTQILNMMSQYWNTKIQLCPVLFGFCDKKSVIHGGLLLYPTLLNRRSLFHDEFAQGLS